MRRMQLADDHLPCSVQAHGDYLDHRSAPGFFWIIRFWLQIDRYTNQWPGGDSNMLGSCLQVTNEPIGPILCFSSCNVTLPQLP